MIHLAILAVSASVLVGCAAPGTQPLPPRDQTRCVVMTGPDSKIRYRDKTYQQYECPGYGFLTIEIIKPKVCQHDS